MSDDFRDLNNEAIKAFMCCLVVAGLFMVAGVVILFVCV